LLLADDFVCLKHHEFLIVQVRHHL